MVSPPMFDHEELDVDQFELMRRAARLSNARPVWTLLWPKDLPFWNEFKPAKKC
jgi:hypothetical protein